MLKHVLIFFGLITNSFADCEMIDSGYHTIATYKKEESDYFKERITINYTISDKKINLKIKPEFLTYSKVISTIELLKTIQLGEVTCPIAEKGKLVLNMLSSDMKVEISLCESLEKADDQVIDGIAILDVANSKLILPKKIEAISADSFDKNTLNETEKNINDFLKNKFFRGSPKIVLSPEDFVPKSFKHTYFHNTNLIITNVTAASTDINKKLNLEFEIVFLTLNGVSWYIADSSFIDPCYPAYIQNEIYRKEGDGVLVHGGISELKTGYIYDNPAYPSIIKFESPHILYYVDFNKKLVVVEKDLGTIERMTEEPGYGILTKRPDVE